MPSEIVKQCSKLLAAKNLNVAFAESATAGRMCSEFALTEDSGKILRGGISCYEVFVKEQILKVTHTLIEEFTPESQEVTSAIARNAAKFFNSKVTVAVTGLITPGGSETKEKPVGTIFLCIITPTKTIKDRTVFNGDPEAVILQSVDRAAELIIQDIE